MTKISYSGIEISSPPNGIYKTPWDCCTFPIVTVPSYGARPMNKVSPSSVSPPGIAFGGTFPPSVGIQTGLHPQRTYFLEVKKLVIFVISLFCFENTLYLKNAYLIIGFSILHPTPSYVTNSMARFNFAWDKSSFMLCPANEQRFFIRSSFYSTRWNYTIRRITPTVVTDVNCWWCWRPWIVCCKMFNFLIIL